MSCVAVVLVDWEIWPPMALYCPPTARAEGLRATVIVTVNAVIGAGWLIRTCSSMNHGLLLVTAPVIVALPPPGPLATVSATVRLSLPAAALLALMVTVALPRAAVELAASVSVLVLP